MQPSDDNQQRNVQVPSRQGQPVLRADREAAAAMMRQQIDSIYDQDTSTPSKAYHQTHSEITDHTSSGAYRQTNDWQHYHSAWQSYYQQYYERYYMAQLIRRRQETVRPDQADIPFAQDKTAASSSEPQTITKDEAVSELREKLLNEVRGRSQQFRRSRHFMPLVAAIAVAITFSLLQYNRFLVAQVKAYVSPGSIDPQNVVLDPTTNTKVGPEPKVIIPKINVDAPVVYDITTLEEPVIQNKLKSGVVHYPIPGADGFPGQTGNTVLLGHSSNDVFDDGAYKFVFVQLEKLQKGDTFYLHYRGTRYTYSITEKKIIEPTQVSELVVNSSKPLASLVTCTPPGTALKRLVITGEQISPDPSTASARSGHPTGTSSKPENIAGNSPTLFERLFGLH